MAMIFDMTTGTFITDEQQVDAPKMPDPYSSGEPDLALQLVEFEAETVMHSSTMPSELANVDVAEFIQDMTGKGN